MSAATSNGSFERSLRNRAAIVGIGQTEFSKASGRSELQLACEATRAALDDAGLRPQDVDGLVTFTMDIVNDVSHCEIFDALRLSDGPVARIQLPERICSGTHAYWADAATLTPQG